MQTISHDLAANEDLLGRDRFAQQISTAIANYFNNFNESIVVGITGPWGSGKSTLLSFIEKHLCKMQDGKPEHLKIIHFNPWVSAFLDSEELQRALLETIIKELENMPWKNKLDKGNDAFKNYLKYLQHLRWLKHIHPVANNIVKAIEEYTNEAPVHSLSEVRQQADKLLLESETRIYIFIDDLDRLSNEEIAVIFKMIKYNISFKNTCFVIAYDKLVVAKALSRQFQSGEAYLEKIIQADFAVPEILDEQMENLFFSELKNLLSHVNLTIDEEEVFTVWKYFGLKDYFKNVRDLKRYFNSLLLSLPNVGENVNLIDFISLEAIKVFDYLAYTKIYDDYQIIQRKFTEGPVTFDHTFINQYKKESTKALLRYLFVQNDFDFLPNEPSLNAKKLRRPESFQRYYSLNVSSKDITEDSLKQFIQFNQARATILQDVLKQGRMMNFLRRLGDGNLSDHYNLTDLNVIDAFLKFWDGQGKDITIESEALIWSAYFNLAHSFRDKFQAARYAVGLLVMKESEFQPIRLIFNHFIFWDEQRHHSKIHGAIREQLDLAKPELFKSFTVHLVKMSHNHFWQVANNNNSFVGFVSILSFAKHCPESYVKELESSNYLDNPQLALFLVKQYFIRSLTEELPTVIDLSRKDLLLPDMLWHRFSNTLRSAKPGTWPEQDTSLVEQFLQQVESIKH
jgi:hypothetical protein